MRISGCDTGLGVAPIASSTAVAPVAGAAVLITVATPEEEELCEKEIYSE
jgi:hypothetical protein